MDQQHEMMTSQRYHEEECIKRREEYFTRYFKKTVTKPVS